MKTRPECGSGNLDDKIQIKKLEKKLKKVQKENKKLQFKVDMRDVSLERVEQLSRTIIKRNN